MKMFKKVISAVTASALTLSMAAGSAAMFTSVSAADMTAIELVDDMGLGWNLGNTFDSYNVSSWAPDIETGWHNPKTTETMITAIKNSGFNAVRIPITWQERTDSSTYDIDDEYLARVKEVVDYCVNNDMYAIINMHWDFSGDGASWLNQGLSAKTQFLTMWTEIANYFKDYDNKLVFEDMNEVTFDYSVLNEMNAAFVETVRATGGNNADRLLLLAGSNTDLTNTCNSSFVVPDDDMVAVSIHYYTPPAWCVATPGTSWGYASTWGSDAEVQAVYNDFAKMKSYFVDQGIPVIIGEYGVLTEDANGKDAEDIALYLDTVASAGLQTEGISTFLWDTSGNGDMNFFDRTSLTWYDSNVEAIYTKLSSGNVEIPDGLVLTDKVTYTPDTMTLTETNDYKIDISVYRDVAVIKAVIVEGSVTSASGATAFSGGGALAFNGFQDGSEERSYIQEGWYFDASNMICTTEIDGILTNSAGEQTATYEMEYDYMLIDQNWTWSEVTGDEVTVTVDKVTLVFDQKIYVDESTGVIVPDDETTEPTTEEDTTEEPTTEEPTTEPTTEGGTADVKYGDANNDGEVSVADVILVNQAYMKTATLDDTGAANADVDSDGDVDLTDSLNILKSLIDLVTLPIA